jgi:hypothetical protein
MRQCGALRNARSPAGILQEQQVVATQGHWLEREIGAFSESIRKRDDIGESGVDVRTGNRGAGAVAQTNVDHSLDRCPVDNFSERRRDAVEDNNNFDAGVVQLVFKFARRIERIDIHLDGAGADDPQQGKRKGRDIGKHDGNAVSLLYAKPGLQVRGELARQPICVSIGQRLVEASKRGLICKGAHGALEHFQN